MKTDTPTATESTKFDRAQLARAAHCGVFPPLWSEIKVKLGRTDGIFREEDAFNGLAMITDAEIETLTPSAEGGTSIGQFLLVNPTPRPRPMHQAA